MYLYGYKLLYICVCMCVSVCLCVYYVCIFILLIIDLFPIGIRYTLPCVAWPTRQLKPSITSIFIQSGSSFQHLLTSWGSTPLLWMLFPSLMIRCPFDKRRRVNCSWRSERCCDLSLTSSFDEDIFNILDFISCQRHPISFSVWSELRGFVAKEVLNVILKL